MVKAKTIYVNKELEKRINDKDRAEARAYLDKQDAISYAAKEGNKSPKSMFLESMRHLNKLSK